MNRFMQQCEPCESFQPAELVSISTPWGTVPSELPLSPEVAAALSADFARPRAKARSANALPKGPSGGQAQRGNGFFRRQIANRFHDLGSGSVEVFDRHGQMKLGQSSLGSQAGSGPNAFENGSAAGARQPLAVKVLIGDTKFYRRTLLGGTIGVAESYMDGQWVTDDLTALIRIMIRNLDRFTKLEGSWAKLKNSLHFLQHLRRKNSIEGSRQNIHDHYDLGNDFYQLFLDPTMNYSSGVFASPAEDSDDIANMHEASLRKMDMICDKLQLTSLDHVLEIGTGWGGLAIHMAQRTGAKVTTTTISREQHRLATERVKKAGLSDRITVLLKDYRELTGKYDKIVSIEMIEAVGHQYYDRYFSQCADLLTDDGVMLLQSITMSEQNFQFHIRHVDFIRKYVFPGGCLPSVTALANSVAKATDMRMLDQQDITPHYVKTLAHWRIQFMNKLPEVRALGYGESFIRLWHFYLCYCEAAFAERRVHNIHVMFAKPNCRIDPASNFAMPATRSCAIRADEVRRDTSAVTP